MNNSWVCLSSIHDFPTDFGDFSVNTFILFLILNTLRMDPKKIIDPGLNPKVSRVYQILQENGSPYHHWFWPMSGSGWISEIPKSQEKVGWAVGKCYPLVNVYITNWKDPPFSIAMWKITGGYTVQLIPVDYHHLDSSRGYPHTTFCHCIPMFLPRKFPNFLGWNHHWDPTYLRSIHFILITLW